MSKLVVYILDRLVWMLLITAFTTQALQMVGFIETPKGYQAITYSKGSDYNFELSIGGSDGRWKRETADRSPFIDSLFNIPIQTLNAINNLVQNSRPAIKSLREYAVRRYHKSSSVKTTTSTESTNSYVQKRSYPVFVLPKGQIEKIRV